MIAKTMRKVVRIDEDKCDGCGACVPSCAEGAIQIIDGKARLVADNLCDGLGNCLGTCPKDAITIEERPADEFDEHAVEVHRHFHERKPEAEAKAQKLPCGCPGTAMRKLKPVAGENFEHCSVSPSRLGNFPVQLTLLPERGDIWDGADVLLSADCVGFAVPDFHDRLLAGKTLAVACPKLDDAQAYVQKLARIFAANNVHSVTVARMEVPCCSALTRIVETALTEAGREDIPIHELVVSVEGAIISVRIVKKS